MEPDESAIQEENAVDQRIVPFMGDDLAAALTSGGDIYISLNGMIAALGLNARGQTQRIQRTPTLAKGLRRIPLETSGGVQRLNCLRVDKVALWVAGIEPSRVKPEFQAKIEAYQEELAPIATQVFLRVMGIAPAQPAQPLAAEFAALMDLVLDLREQMVAVPGQIADLSVRMDTAVELLQSLAQRQDTTDASVARLEAKTQGHTPAQQARVREAIAIIADTDKFDYAQIYTAIKRRFQVASYKQVPDTRYEELMQYLREMWKQAKSDDSPEQGNLF